MPTGTCQKEQGLHAAGPGYKYIRVAHDILLIAIGTRMLVDAIEDAMGEL